MTVDAAALEELVHRNAIRELMVRYVFGIDRRDVDLALSCFTPTGTFEVSAEARLDGGGVGNLVVGPGHDDLRPFLSATPARFKIGTHFLGPSLIDVTGDRAIAESYSISFALPTEDDTVVLMRSVRYLDRLVETDRVWAIDHRLMTLDWSASVPRSFSLEFAGRVGSFGHAAL